MTSRSHVRIYHSNAGVAGVSSSVTPLPRPDAGRATYAVRCMNGGVTEIGIEEVYTMNKRRPTSSQDPEEHKKRVHDETTKELMSPALVYFHVSHCGHTFIEATQAAASVSVRPIYHWSPSTTEREPWLLPTQSNNDKMKVLLEKDTMIMIDDKYKLLWQNIELSTIPSLDHLAGTEDVQISGTYDGREHKNGEVVEQVQATGETGRENRLNTPTGDAEAGGSGNGGENKITKVLDTPHGRTRYIDPHVVDTQESNFEPTPFQILSWDVSRAETSFHTAEHQRSQGDKSRMVRDKVDGSEDESEEEEEELVPTLPTNHHSLQKEVPDDEDIAAQPVLDHMPLTTSVSPTKVDHGNVEGEGSDTCDEDDNPSEAAVADPEDCAEIPLSELPNTLPQEYHYVAPVGLKTYRDRRRTSDNSRKKERLPSSIPETSSQPTDKDPANKASSDIRNNGKSPKHRHSSPLPGFSSSAKNTPIADRRASLVTNMNGSAMKDRKVIEESSEVDETTPTKAPHKSPTPSPTASTEALLEALPSRRGKGRRESGDAGKLKVVQNAQPVSVRKRKRSGEQKVPVEKDSDAMEEDATEDARDSPEIEPSMQSRIEVQAELDNEELESKTPARKKPRKSSGVPEKTPAKTPATKGRGSVRKKKDQDESQLTDITTATTSTNTETTSQKATKTPATRRPRKLDGTTASKNESQNSSTSHSTPRTNVSYKGPTPPKVVFSNSEYASRKDLAGILRTLGMKKANSVTEKNVTHLVVGSGGLVRSAKLALAIALGIPIVEDSWLLESLQHPVSPQLMDPVPAYVPVDPKHEAEWAFSLSDAMERGKSGELRKLFKDVPVVYLTPALLAHLKVSGQDTIFLDILKAAGAERVLKKAPTRNDEVDERCMVIGAETDRDKVGREGWRVFKAEVVTMSLLRGRLEDKSEEFRLMPSDGDGTSVAGTANSTQLSSAAGREASAAAATPARKGRATRAKK